MVRTLFASLLLVLVACNDSQPAGHSFFERRIQPLLTERCVGGTSPCHRDDGNGVALGNLDLSSFAALHQRPDVLTRYGSYPEPLLLIKATASQGMVLTYQGKVQDLEIQHGGGPILAIDSLAYFDLKRWLDAGATEDGVAPAPRKQTGSGACAHKLPDGLDLTAAQEPGLSAFRDVQPLLVGSCGAASCHGNPLADFYLTCGSNDDETRANFLVAQSFVAPAVADSELLTKPLDPAHGGQAHGGGVWFASPDDPDYRSLRGFAVTAGVPAARQATPARRFFEDQVVPLMVRRGCALPACHSPLVAQKLKLRGGSYGFFSQLALDRSYHEAKDALLALASPDARVSRLVAKNLVPSHGGIAHRAGALLETPGGPADPADCPAFAPGATPLCTLAEWRGLERAELPAAARSDVTPGRSLPLVYVERPADPARFVDMTRPRPGADLMRATALLGAGGRPVSLSGHGSLLGGCPGVGAGRADVDVRRPVVSDDGQRVLFAMRAGTAAGLDVFEVGLDGSGCRRVTSDGGQLANGIAIDNFDPLYVSDTRGTWVVYASTRGGAGGPARSPRSFLPESDLWRQLVAGGPPEQMTFLRGSEAQPGLMADGQLTLVAEKLSPDFYQIAGRRLNWDLSDYHPLLAQRAANYQGRGGYPLGAVPAGATLRPSIGYAQATDVREALDGDFLVILADESSAGAGGALGIFNRSIGPFEAGRGDAGYVRSLRVMPGPTGRAGEATGVYRSPYPLLDGAILASYAAGVDVGRPDPVGYHLVVVDPVSGERTPLYAGPGSEVEAVLAYARPTPTPFVLHPAPAGASAETAVVHFPDLPLLASLLDSNNRRGRDVASLRLATRVRFFTEAAPPPGCLSGADVLCAPAMAAPLGVYEARHELGSAPLAKDGSAYLKLPAGVPLELELVGGDGQVIFRTREETQLGPFETIGIGVPPTSFNGLCAVCHGSISGRELDIHVSVDALTGASATQAHAAGPRPLEMP